MRRNTITCVSEFNGIKLPNSCEEKILDVIIDNELKSDPRMCKKGICVKKQRKN